MVYRAIFASRASIKHGVSVHPTVVAIRTFASLRSHFRPKKVHVFWDVTKTSLWRSQIYPDYKKGRENKFDFDVDAMVSRVQVECVHLFRYMKCTQYAKEYNEADDLIYAFVKTKSPETTLIATSDKDAEQMSFKFDTSYVYDPGSKTYQVKPKPEYDPILVKSLSGDKSDNIKNYHLVGELTAKKILREDRLSEFLTERGSELFDFNKKLIDLDSNPHLQDNINYINSVKINDDFDLEKIKEIIKKFDIQGLYSEIGERILPFKNM